MPSNMLQQLNYFCQQLRYLEVPIHNNVVIENGITAEVLCKTCSKQVDYFFLFCGVHRGSRCFLYVSDDFHMCSHTNLSFVLQSLNA